MSAAPSTEAGKPPALIAWFDSWALHTDSVDERERRVEWLRVLPFLGMHAACLLVLVVGWSPAALAVAAGLYLIRMFGITAGYHRYFSHRSFRTGRGFQFVLALLGAMAVQRGPLWWAAHHRAHHRHSDREQDEHSLRQHGFWWSHCGWFTSRWNHRTRVELVPDWLRYPELVFLDRFDFVVPVLYALAMLGLGALLEAVAPAWGTGPWQMLVWGFFVSTAVLYHGTFTINSLAHRFGSRRFDTADDSRNNGWLALITLGEGWHNNHHRYPNSARQGFYRAEFDPCYWALRGLAAVGVVRGIREVPARILEEGAR
jgi:stearoyl-CoA desaturase (delta-9 desaturase)